MKRVVLVLVLLGGFLTSNAQVGAGFTVSNDLYNIYSNPIDVPDVHRKNGSALLNLGIGPKLWFGGKDFSFSVESLVNFSPLGISLKDFKGVGAVSFPIMGKLNFKGLSGFNKDTGLGFSLGGGIQYNKTELFGLKESYEAQGVKRDFYRTYNVQTAVGVGLTGFSGYLFTRYGFNPDLDGAHNFHIGLQLDFNMTELRKIDKPESAL